jgi:hypothetical protein
MTTLYRAIFKRASFQFVVAARNPTFSLLWIHGLMLKNRCAIRMAAWRNPLQKLELKHQTDFVADRNPIVAEERNSLHREEGADAVPLAKRMKQ